MIIWLASYPKSGNTWVRNIIDQIVNNDIKKKEEVFRDFTRIKRYPSKQFISDLPKIPYRDSYSKDQKKSVIDHTVKNWELSQKEINKTKEINILKTHNMLCKINLDNQNFSFTNEESSLGVVHIVRDPRNVVTSIKNHYSIETQEKCVEFLLDQMNWTGFKNHDTPQLLSSWKNHYNSWKKFPKNYFLIKYEDLLKDTEKEINRMINYLSKFFKIKISNTQINEIIENTSFENFSKQEKEGKFVESVKNDKGDIKKFFYLGPKNDWKHYLSDQNRDIITNAFENEMKELGYL
tara:strand:- start:50 stop:928 length:879 start_codon:yes stop_codon:yes gene_type:complete